MQVNKIVQFSIMFLFGLGVFSTTTTTQQEPSQSTNPCAAAEMRAAQAESRSAGLALKAEVAQKDAGALQERLAGEQSASAKLAASYEGEQRKTGTLEKKIAEQKELLDLAVAERDAAQGKIKAANGRFACEVFHIGCIGEK